MTTRRTTNQEEKPLANHQNEVPSLGKSNITPAVPKYALLSLYELLDRANMSASTTPSYSVTISFCFIHVCLNAPGVSLTQHVRCREVIMKLLFFTFAMIVAPISSYFLTLNTVYSGKSTLPSFLLSSPFPLRLFLVTRH